MDSLLRRPNEDEEVLEDHQHPGQQDASLWIQTAHGIPSDTGSTTSLVSGSAPSWFNVPSASSLERPKNTSTSVPTTWPSSRHSKPDTACSCQMKTDRMAEGRSKSQTETCRTTWRRSSHGTRWDGCKDEFIHSGSRRSQCSTMTGVGQRVSRLSSNNSSAPRSRHGTTPSGFHGASGPSHRRGAKDCIKVPNSVACEHHRAVAWMRARHPSPNCPKASLELTKSE